jgi:hypothetical protein
MISDWGGQQCPDHPVLLWRHHSGRMRLSRPCHHPGPQTPHVRGERARGSPHHRGGVMRSAAMQKPMLTGAAIRLPVIAPRDRGCPRRARLSDATVGPGLRPRRWCTRSLRVILPMMLSGQRFHCHGLSGGWFGFGGDDVGSGTWRVVPGSCSGGLRSIRRSARPARRRRGGPARRVRGRSRRRRCGDGSPCSAAPGRGRAGAFCPIGTARPKSREREHRPRRSAPPTPRP